MITGLHPGVEYHIVNTLGWSDLRPLQKEAVRPVRAGEDCLLLAPTAGGKTEAAIFPLLSQMADENWQGLTILYVTPLRALLNNLHPRLTTYASWVGRTVGLWHGDTLSGERKRLLAQPPDILLTTPESLEAMLVSTGVDHRSQFAHLRAVVVDELHAFAGDDRGWHLLAVLERLQHLTGHHIQRIGLTATVGNPDALLEWMKGSNSASEGCVVSPQSGTPVAPEITVDYVGSIENAATIIAAMHHGEKRLAFTDSRSQAEDLAAALRTKGITTFVSHSSLSADERRQSEQAFAEARDCVVVATSTLELGIDVGDLDRVIQIDAPRSVASFLQRLGRTGRRPGTARNCLFLSTREDALVRSVALMVLWESGFVEAITPPPTPRHISAQQLMALALQEGQFGSQTWQEWWNGLSIMRDGAEVIQFLRSAGFLESDSGMLFVGHAAERAFGRRNFMELTSVFTAEPELRVFLGRKEIGSVSPLSVSNRIESGEPRTLLLGGRTWKVTAIDWRHRIIHVVEHAGTGRSRWTGGTAQQSFELSRACRDVLLGATPDVELSRRAMTTLERIRVERSLDVDDGGLVLQTSDSEARWWTFAGTRANASLAAGLARQGLNPRVTSEAVIASAMTVSEVRALCDVQDDALMVDPDQNALDGLKFSAALPRHLALRTLSERLSDVAGARESIHKHLVAAQG